jgi:hypothetical protein
MHLLKLLSCALCLAAVAACSPRHHETASSGQNLNSALVDCSALTPAERAQVTARNGCAEIFRPDETGS